jgi:hypothetical protein
MLSHTHNPIHRRQFLLGVAALGADALQLGRPDGASAVGSRSMIDLVDGPKAPATIARRRGLSTVTRTVGNLEVVGCWTPSVRSL